MARFLRASISISPNISYNVLRLKSQFDWWINLYDQIFSKFKTCWPSLKFEYTTNEYIMKCCGLRAYQVVALHRLFARLWKPSERTDEFFFLLFWPNIIYRQLCTLYSIGIGHHQMKFKKRTDMLFIDELHNLTGVN